MSALPSPLPVVVGRLTKNRREAVVVALKEFEGVRLIDLRVYAATPEGDKPTPKGLALDVRRLPALREALVRAESQARRLGLLPTQEAADV